MSFPAISSLTLALVDAKSLALVPPLLFAAGFGFWMATFHLRITVLLLLLVRPTLDLVGAGPLAGALTLLLIGVWALLNLDSWRKIRHPWMIGPFVLIGYAAVTVLFAPVRSEAVSGVIRLAGSLAMIWFIAHAFGSKPKDRLLVLLVASASCFIPVLLGIWEYVNDAGYQEGDVKRIRASFENANVFGFYLLALLPLVAATGFLTGKSVKKAAYVLLPILLALLYVTYTRTALVAVLVASAVVGLSKKKNRGMKIAVIGFILVASSFLPSVRARFSDLDDPNPYGRAGNSNSFAWRVEHWQLISTYIPSQPATGVGLNGTRAAIRSEFLAHSAWLQLAFELGAFGVLVIALTARQIRRMHQQAKIRATRELDVLLMASRFSCLAFVIIGIADNVLVATALHWYFFLPTALLSGAMNQRMNAVSPVERVLDAASYDSALPAPDNGPSALTSTEHQALYEPTSA
jgi:O-Antigen ligase